MPFGYGTRTQQFIDTANAGPNDRIKVTLENGQTVILLLSPDQMKHRGENTVKLCVDKELTQTSVLEPHYRHAVSEARKHGQRKDRKQYTLGTARSQVEIIVYVTRDSETFDHSPLPGEYLSVMSLFPHVTGSGSHFSSPVKTVEFITI